MIDKILTVGIFVIGTGIGLIYLPFKFHNEKDSIDDWRKDDVHIYKTGALLTVFGKMCVVSAKTLKNLSNKYSEFDKVRLWFFKNLSSQDTIDDQKKIPVETVNELKNADIQRKDFMTLVSETREVIKLTSEYNSVEEKKNIARKEFRSACRASLFLVIAILFLGIMLIFLSFGIIDEAFLYLVIVFDGYLMFFLVSWLLVSCREAYKERSAIADIVRQDDTLM